MLKTLYFQDIKVKQILCNNFLQKMASLNCPIKNNNFSLYIQKLIKMISLKDYTLLYTDYFNNNHHNQNQIKSQPPFFYLYPYENSPPQKNYFTNQKQELFTVTKLENQQQCQALIQLIKSSESPILSPSQEFCIVKHKNANSQKKYLVISSDVQQNTLQKIAENHFFQNVNVPSQQFCTYLIERVIEIHRYLQQKGLHLKVITPSHILVYQNQIFLNFPFPYDIFDWNPNTFLEESQKSKSFCAPQILKLYYIEKKMEQSQNVNTSSIMERSDPISYSGNYENKEFKKAILYSLGLTILYCFGFHVPLQDRITALKNPNKINIFLDQLRKQIKLHHDGKYVSKLLKLMLQHSESLRDTISTFSYKMNSVQFKLLKKVCQKNKSLPTNQQSIQTESEVNSQPFLNTTSGKKTIDIRISAVSNTSSVINKSWLSVSQQNLQAKYVSPSQINKTLQIEKQKDFTNKSKKSLVSNQLNEIQEIKQPESPIQFDIEWDQDSSMRGSSKSSKEKSKSSSDKDKKDKKIQLLNKISQKQEVDDEIDIKITIGKDQMQFQKEKDQIFQRKSSPRKIVTFKTQINIVGQQNHISRSQIGTKSDLKNLLANNISIVFQNNKRISGTQSKKSNSKNDTIEPQKEKIPSFDNIQSKKEEIIFKVFSQQVLPKQEKKVRQNVGKQQKVQVKFPIKNIVAQKQKYLNAESLSLNEPSTMCILNKQSNFSQAFEQSLNNSTTLQAQPDQIDEQNESMIFQEPFFNEQQLKRQQTLIKQKKASQKQKLTQRKKDQYNERSRAILITLIVICGVFKFIDILLENGKIENVTK